MDRYPRSNRAVEERGAVVTEEVRAVARQYGREFFDGDRIDPRAVLAREHPGGVEAVLAAGPGDDAVVRAVGASEAVAQLFELAPPLAPVYLPLQLGDPAGVADALGVEVNRRLRAVPHVLVLDRRVRPLVRDHAGAAEADLLREAVAGRGVAAPWSVLVEVNGDTGGVGGDRAHRLAQI